MLKHLVISRGYAKTYEMLPDDPNFSVRKKHSKSRMTNALRSRSELHLSPPNLELKAPIVPEYGP